MCGIAGSFSGFASARTTHAAAPQATAVTTQTFTAVADAYVDASRPKQNFGSNLKLRTDGSPVLRSFLRFNVTSLSGSVSKATLRVYAMASGARSQTIEAHNVADSTWGESAISNATAPAVGAVIASASKIPSGTWVTYDVTAAVRGTGLVSFALTTSASQDVPWSSKEGSNPPQLVVETGSSGTPPANTALPVITGTAQVGQTLASSDGAWSGSTPMTFPRQWRRCDANGLACGDISGATGQNYIPTTADAGLRLRVVVTATNTYGKSAATSSATGVVQPVSGGGAACGTRATPPTKYAHVIWIVMENKKYSSVIGNTNAPYINDLANSCGLATNYFAITHPSLPNYIAATSGDTWGISNDGPPSAHPLAVPSIFSQVKGAGLTWRSYQEDAPAKCNSTTDTTLFARKHDPALYYTGIQSDCASWDIPMGTTSSGAFLTDLNNGTLPAFALVTPNLCNDMHDCPVATGDAWLLGWVPKILASSSYRAGNTALVIFWDEAGGTGSNQVATIVVSPSTRVGTMSNTSFTHYSLLKTTEQLLGISTYLGHAGDSGTQSMRAGFNF
jgi:hypothetical protein